VVRLRARLQPVERVVERVGLQVLAALVELEQEHLEPVADLPLLWAHQGRLVRLALAAQSANSRLPEMFPHLLRSSAAAMLERFSISLAWLVARRLTQRRLAGLAAMLVSQAVLAV